MGILDNIFKFLIKIFDVTISDNIKKFYKYIYIYFFMKKKDLLALTFGVSLPLVSLAQENDSTCRSQYTQVISNQEYTFKDTTGDCKFDTLTKYSIVKLVPTFQEEYQIITGNYFQRVSLDEDFIKVEDKATQEKIEFMFSLAQKNKVTSSKKSSQKVPNYKTFETYEDIGNISQKSKYNW